MMSRSSSEVEENSHRSGRSDVANPDEEDRDKQEKVDYKAGLGLLQKLNKSKMTLVNGIEMSETMTTS